MHPTLLPRIAAAAALLIFSAAACAAQTTASQPAGELFPLPTGPHKTGRVSFHWIDKNRPELETRAPDDKRELMVHVFYPANSSTSGVRATYLPDADAMNAVWNREQLARIASTRAFSCENADVLRGKEKFPVVVFAPGGGMKGLTYHTLFEDLASHGWVVAVLDPPYNAHAVRFPDGRVLGNLAQSERTWPQARNPMEEKQYYLERLRHWSADISFVIDQLTVLNNGNSLFTQRLDFQRGVGVFGHSRGGQAAGAVRLLDERVRSGINLDGNIGDGPIQPVKGEGVYGSQPFLWIQKTLGEPPTDAQLKKMGRTRAEFDAEGERIIKGWHTRLATVSGGAMRVYIERPGIKHVDFSDEPFWDGSMTADALPGKLKTVADTRSWVRAFFDGTVRGEWADLKRLASSKTQPHITVHVFGKMWPQ
ncbi:MAG: alpha/beta hydrolase family protein [Planctomycetota bacterium]